MSAWLDAPLTWPAVMMSLLGFVAGVWASFAFATLGLVREERLGLYWWRNPFGKRRYELASYAAKGAIVTVASSDFDEAWAVERSLVEARLVRSTPRPWPKAPPAPTPPPATPPPVTHTSTTYTVTYPKTQPAKKRAKRRAK